LSLLLKFVNYLKINVHLCEPYAFGTCTYGSDPRLLIPKDIFGHPEVYIGRVVILDKIFLDLII
jgi:hypothetical protein